MEWTFFFGVFPSYGLESIGAEDPLLLLFTRVERERTVALLAAWHRAVTDEQLFDAHSFNLDFHSVPYYGDDPQVQRHFVSARSRAQPSLLAFLAQDASGRAFCYSNADLRKGEEAEEIFRFIEFWKRQHGALPRHLVFDSRLTTYAHLARLDQLGITFITLRRRSAVLLQEVADLPASAWRRVTLDVPARKYKTPRVFEQSIRLAGATLRQLFVVDLDHEQPTILLTNDPHSSHAKLLTRYAQRMLIEKALSDAVRFFHMDALSSAVGMKVDFDMALLVVASGLYRLLARRMRGYADARRATSSVTSSTLPPTSRSPTPRSASTFTAAPTCPSSSPPDCSILRSPFPGGRATLCACRCHPQPLPNRPPR